MISQYSSENILKFLTNYLFTYSEIVTKYFPIFCIVFSFLKFYSKLQNFLYIYPNPESGFIIAAFFFFFFF